MARGGKTTYSDAENAFIRDLWTKGRSAAQIRDLFSAEYGRDVTRNAIIARVHRMGLTGTRGDPNLTRAMGAVQMHKDRRAVEQRTRPVKPVIKREGARPLVRPVTFGQVPADIVSDHAANLYTFTPMDVEAVSDEGAGGNLLDLRAGQCRWPMKGGGFCAHGCERERGRYASFCPTHKRRASDGKPAVRDYVSAGTDRKRAPSASQIGRRFNGF